MRQRKFANKYYCKGDVIELSRFDSLKDVFKGRRAVCIQNSDYIVLDDGRVYRRKSELGVEPIVLIEIVPTENNAGYLQVSNPLTKKGAIPVHRLVALFFIPNPYNEEQVDHIDRNKHNNKVENLRWVSPSENMCYYYNIVKENKNED